jgi:transposase-like protein
MVRNSVKYVAYKDLKEVTKDLNKIYTAATEEMAHCELKQFGINGIINILLFLISGKEIG